MTQHIHAQIIGIFNEIRTLELQPVDIVSAERALTLFRNARSLVGDNPDDAVCIDLRPRLDRMIDEMRAMLTDLQQVK